jgi:transposase
MEQTHIPTHSIGIDVGKRELVACIRCSQSGIGEPPAAFPNSSIGLKKFIVHLKRHGIGQETPILLESTGPYHWHAARTLADSGYFAKVANPLHTKHIARHSVRKRKTDKVDAAQLAFLASQGYGYPFVETEEMAYRKALVRHYWKLWDTARTHIAHERYLEEHRSITRFAVSPLLLKRCETLKKEIVVTFSTGNDLKYLDSIPGVSPFLGAALLAELAPLHRFTNLRQVIAFAGLDPSVKQSGGGAARHGKLSKRGSPRLRQVLYMAAFGSFAKGPFRSLYDNYKGRGIHHTAVLCILGRKILRIAVALLKKRRVFDESYLKVVEQQVTVDMT